MAKALIASWHLDGDGVSVTIRNLTADDLCSFQLQAQANLMDLEAKLVDPRGPLFDQICSPIMNFYTATDPSNHLDVHLLVSDLDDEEFYIKQADVGIWLEKWPYTGKFLEAMQYSRFDPGSKDFDLMWTAKTAKMVAPREAFRLVREVLHGWPRNSDSDGQFVQIFGKLVSSIEPWDMFQLQELQRYSGGIKYLKHAVCQHFVDFACSTATSMVSHDLSKLLPIFLQYKRKSSGRDANTCFVAGPAFPASFDPRVARDLRINDVQVCFGWSCIAQALLYFDWDFEREGVESFDKASKIDRPEPEAFQSLQPLEILQMVHVQLRLSFCGVAEVQGTLNEACVRILAELLCYKLTILKFHPDTNLDAIGSFDERSEHRGSLVLLTGLPATCKGNVFAGQRQRKMILCYSCEIESL
eukprot:Skav218028  [mRNA]  locus=scaffold214:223158:224399:+ [translate_table: standard]